jgi:poly(A) polymerase
MNPPRVELDQAVRLIFAAHGIVIKKSHFTERGRLPEKRNNAGEGSAGGESSSPERAPKKRRRRRRKPGTGPSGGSLTNKPNQE